MLLTSPRKLWRKQYSGPLTAARMVIPKDMVCLVYGPSGAVTITAEPRNGSSPWSIDMSPYGRDTVVPVDGMMFGYVSSSGTGTVQYVLMARNIAPMLKLDTVSPGVPLQFPLGTVIDPRQIRTLTGNDVPGRGWTLGKDDNPQLFSILGTDGTDPRQIRALASATDNLIANRNVVASLLHGSIAAGATGVQNLFAVPTNHIYFVNALFVFEVSAAVNMGLLLSQTSVFNYIYGMNGNSPAPVISSYYNGSAVANIFTGASTYGMQGFPYGSGGNTWVGDYQIIREMIPLYAGDGITLYLTAKNVTAVNWLCSLYDETLS